MNRNKKVPSSELTEKLLQDANLVQEYVDYLKAIAEGGKEVAISGESQKAIETNLSEDSRVNPINGKRPSNDLQKRERRL